MTEEKTETTQPEETPQVQEEEKVDIEGIIGLLEKANISDPQQLEGKLQNAAGYQKVQSSLSQAEQRLKALEDENRNLQAAVNNPNRTSYDLDEFGEPQQGVDIESSIRKVLREEKAAEQKQMLKTQKAQMAAYQKIVGDKHYNVVKDEFNAKLQDPETNFKLQSGDMDYVELYKDTVLDFYQSTTQKSLEALNSLKGSTQTNVPHVEDSARAPDAGTPELSDTDKEVERLTNKAKEGEALHADERAKLINSQLGDLFK